MKPRTLGFADSSIHTPTGFDDSTVALPGHYRDYFNDPFLARRAATTGYPMRIFQVQYNSVKA